MKIAVGIDPSLKGTGIAVLKNEDFKPVLIASQTVKLPLKMRGFDRTKAIATAVAEALTTHSPDIVVIENYGFSFKRKTSIVPLAELGGVLRFFIGLEGIPYFEPRPTQVKKFLLGVGEGFADKKAMQSGVETRYGHTLKPDEADAFSMALMGLAATSNIKGLTLDQRELLGELSLVRPQNLCT